MALVTVGHLRSGGMGDLCLAVPSLGICARWLLSTRDHTAHSSISDPRHFDTRGLDLECVCGVAKIPQDIRAGLTSRWSGRVRDKVPSSNAGVRAAQLNR